MLRQITIGRYNARINGELTLHGTTRDDLEIIVQGTLDEKKLTAQGNFSLRQTPYRIKPVSIAAGTLKVKDELKFTFAIVGWREN